MQLVSGTRLGPYEVLSKLGAGGMGEVWKARDTRLDRVVAIKHLNRAHSARFEQEARAIAALNHPHICQIYDVGPDYLVLEFVEGPALQGPLEAERALPLALQIAGALEAAHKRGILHRDLKPANVIVTGGGAKLLDFGLAKLTGDSESDETQTLEGSVMGTAAYMSPEQAKGQAVDARSDVFSFGAVLYEMLSGRRAFGGGSMLETLNAVVGSEPAPLGSPLGEVAKKCLSKDLSQRYQSAAELREALQAVQTGPRAGAPPSIAVLPFANMSRDADDEYFSDGLAEEIINALVKVPGLKVIARTSAFAFKGQNTDIRKIAETLGVTNVLEGSVRRAGNRIRVTAQLITAVDGSHLWSERYDREMTDVFAVQDEIAVAIASALQLKLSASPRRHTPPLPAYEALLRGRHHLQKWTAEGQARGLQSYLDALTLDPGFAQAHVELGLHYFSMATEMQMPVREAAAKMSAAAQRALEIDATLAEAHAVRALVEVLDYNWEEAGKEFALAMSAGHVSPLVRTFYSQFYLITLGRAREALDQLNTALQQDPLSLYLLMARGTILIADDDPAGEASCARLWNWTNRFGFRGRGSRCTTTGKAGWRKPSSITRKRAGWCRRIWR